MDSPLRGRRVVVTRSAEQSEPLCERLRARGVVAIPFPVIRFNPLPADGLEGALSRLGREDWLLFTSGNAVRYFRAATRLLPRARVAAIGSATAEALREIGVEPDFMPTEFVGEALVAGLGDLAGRRVLLPRARIGRPEIVAMLRERGGTVEEIALYDTITAEPTAEAWAALRDPIDLITFTSPSSVRNWLNVLAAEPALAARLGREARVACLGPVTAEEARRRGLDVALVPQAYTIDGLVGAISDYFMENAVDAR